MASIILDCDLMNYPNSGLYHYCLNIGLSINQQLERERKEPMKMYVPKAEKFSFAKSSHIIVEKPWHKLWKPFLSKCRVWHAPFQSGRIIPDKKKYPNVKVLLTVHDLNPLHEGKPLEEQKKSIIHTQSLIDKSDAIVCISEFTKADVLKNCDTGNKPLYVIHNGIHRVNTPSKTKSPERKIERPFLFGMGYVNAKKNYHVLLPLLKYNPGIEMVIAGKLDVPDYIEEMKRAAAAMGVLERLHITGPISEDDKAWYLSNCMAFMHPSLAEGFGAPVVEAMLFGKPLFLSNLTSLPEIGGDAAFYFDSFDEEHMQSVFKEGIYRFNYEQMSEAIINRGKMFDWELSAAKYLKVYETLL
ncbi:MAG: glycosyltransferase family 1 protein [Agriterribacter sp.]